MIDPLDIIFDDFCIMITRL